MCPPSPAGHCLTTADSFPPAHQGCRSCPGPRPQPGLGVTPPPLGHRAKQELLQQQISPWPGRSHHIAENGFIVTAPSGVARKCNFFCPHQLAKGEICCPLKGKTSSFPSFLLGLGLAWELSPLPAPLGFITPCAQPSLPLGAEPQPPLRIPQWFGLEGTLKILLFPSPAMAPPEGGTTPAQTVGSTQGFPPCWRARDSRGSIS